MAQRITIRIKGSDIDAGHVRLSDFVEQLEAIREALRQTERLLTGAAEASVYYRIVDLKHDSPATVVLEPVRKKGSPLPRTARVGDTLVASLRSLKAERNPPVSADLVALESYREIAAPMQHNVQQVEVETSPHKIVSIDRSFSESVDKVIGPDKISMGSVSGRLEKVNIHNVNRFDIFPTVGPQRVTCTFEERLRPKIREALDNYVTVYGRLRYKEWDPFPYAIRVRDIDIHEDASTLPSLNDLHGISPDATGEMSSEDFVRTMRDENW